MFLGMLLVAVLALSGCATTMSSKTSGVAPRRLIIGEDLEPYSLNPVLLEGTLSSTVGGILYSFLLTEDVHGNQIPDAATTVPSLANGGISPDGLRITYHLRPGIRWTDGRPLTARDCIFTFHAIMNPSTNVPDRYGYDQIASVMAPDSRTVVVRLKTPFSPIVDTFLTMESNYPILPEHNLGSLPDLNSADVKRPIIGSGPFTLVEWKHGDHITFAANPRYFRGPPQIDELVMRFVPSMETIINQLRTHEIDAALQLTDPTLTDQIATIPRLHVIATPSFALQTIYLNTQSGLTAERRLRQAIALAIDTESVVRRATRGRFGSANALRAEFGADALANPSPYDPAAARALLDAAGWRVGSDGVRSRAGRPLALTVVITGASPAATLIALEVKEELRAVGIDLAIRAYNVAMMKAPAAAGGPLFGGHFDLAVAQIYSSAGPFAGEYFICAERAPIGFNLSRICRPRIDALFADVIRANDPARRSRDTHALEQLLAVEVPQVPLEQIRTIAAISDRVAGIEPSPLTPYVGMWKWRLDR